MGDIPPSPVGQPSAGSRPASVALDDHPRNATSTPPPMTPSSSNFPIPRVQAVKRPSPRLYFAHFIDDKERFIHFLETVALKRWGQSLGSDINAEVPTDSNEDVEAEKRDQVAVWNTLLELYLSYANPIDPRAGTFADQVVQLLKSEHLPFDPTHALILCSTRNFTPGLVLLWERLGMYEDVLRFWMDKHKEDGIGEASGEVIRCLRYYGPEHPHLYPLVLRFLTSTPELLSKHTNDITQLLEHIDEEGIMPPLAVVQVLSRNGVASVGLVKQWLMTRITDSREQIDMVKIFDQVQAGSHSDRPSRIGNSSSRIEQRPTTNYASWTNWQIPTIHGCSTLPSARHAKANSTYQVFTSCAATATTNGKSLGSSLISKHVPSKHTLLLGAWVSTILSAPIVRGTMG